MLRLTIAFAFLLGTASVAQVGTSSEALIRQITEQIETENCDIPEELVAIVGQSADQRAASAVVLNDLRYIAIAAGSIEVPAIDYSTEKCPRQEENLQLFDADPQVARCPIHTELLRSLRTFAAQYNFYIYAARTERETETCAA